MRDGIFPNSRISVRHLRSFVTVARHGSLTKASKALFVTQSALSLTIQHLEEDLGLKLFDRTTRRIELTTAGEEFLVSAERLLRDFDVTMRNMRELGQSKRGSVTVCVVPSVMASLLPDSAARYIANFPGIEVKLWEDTARNIQMQVLRGRIDFGICSVWFPNPELAFEPLYDDHYGVVVAADHPFAARKEGIEWGELESVSLVGYNVDIETQNQLAHMPGVLDHLRTPAYQAANSVAIAKLVSAGLGISVMSALSARRPPLDKLKFKQLRSPASFRSVGVLYRKERSLPPAAAELLAEIRRELPTLARVHGIRLHG